MTSVPPTPDNDDYTFAIPNAELPGPGEDVLFVIEDSPYTVLVAHTGEPQRDIDEPTEDEAAAEDGPQSWHEVVDVRGQTRTHAAVVVQHGKRSVVNRWTLCSVTNSRRVIGRKRDQQLSTVTCAQCRRRLEAVGEL